MSPQEFEKRLSVIKRGHFKVLPLVEALERLYAGSLPPRSLAITFDDGLADFYLHAHPLLKKFGFPATVYFNTHSSERPHPVFSPVCQYLLWKGRGQVVDCEPLIGMSGQWDLRSAAGRRAAAVQLFDSVVRDGLSEQDKDAFARRLAEMLNADYGTIVSHRILHLMTPDEVAELATENVDFQLHTHRHRTPLDRRLFLDEIHDNRVTIQEITGTSASHFCYPSGVYHPEFLPWLAEARVISATTCDPGIASSTTNALLLPRIIDGEHLSRIEVEGWLTGASAFLPRRKHTPSPPALKASARPNSL
jgi:peptidoglycan/xylan/chitin deacetylase (PgdA/CDA1 family)